MTIRLKLLFVILLSLLMGLSLWLKESIDRRALMEGQDYLFREVQHLQHQINRSLFAPYALSTILRQNGYSTDIFEEVAADLIQTIGGIDNLQLAPGGVVRHIHPLTGNEKAIGHNLLADRARSEGAIAAVESKDLVLAGPLNLVQGGRAIIGRLPVFYSENGVEKFWGFTTVLIKIDTLLDAVDFSAIAERGFVYRIVSEASHWAEPALVTETENYQQLLEGEFSDESSIQQQIIVPGHKWMLTAYLKEDVSDTAWMWGSLFINILLTAFVTFLYYWFAKERELNRQIQKQLIHAQRMSSLGTLAGGIAHEFNNVLASIGGYTELAMLKTQDDSPVRDYLKVINESTERATELIKKIMAFARNDEGEMKRLELKSEVTRALDIVRATIPKNVTINDSLENGLPMVIGDAKQIHQVVQNLINNAYHAVRSSGTHGVISVGLHAEENAVVLRVADTGVGMSRETLEHIFDPFYTTKDVGEGTGLGMSVVHGIIKEHGGTIAIDSGPGKGATVQVSFPAYYPS